MKRALYITGSIMVVIIITNCKKPYTPSVTNANGNYLVVSGIINSGTDSTNIRLSRTMKIDTYNANYATANPETKAIVTVEDDQNATYPLKEATNGNYVAASLNLNTARNYRLRIKTTDGQVYLSDYEPVKISPPIDSVGFTISATGLIIYANTHDVTNNTRYYRWEYEEAWKFEVPYDSPYISVDPLIGRPGSIRTCFANDASSDIVLGSTTKLTQDILYQAPITIIPSSSEKISIRYSILVKQYALTKDGYAFWTSLKTNTENLGSIFDAQPSAAPGNIHCISDASIPVIGYVSMGTIQSKRIFIDQTDLRGFITQPQNLCGLDTVLFKNITPSTAPMNLPIVSLIYSGLTLVGYTRTFPACADCTTRGTLMAPSFWK